MDPLEAHERAAAVIESKATAVGDRWDTQTVCDEWNVRQLLGHVVGGNIMTVKLLDGASAAEARAAVDGAVLDADPIGDLTRTNAEADSALRKADLSMVVDHPAMSMPASQLLQFRTGDLLLHAWDLARSIGADESLDPDVVAFLWDALQPMAPFIGQIGVFGTGPSGSVPDDAPLQQRLLDLTGRRP